MIEIEKKWYQKSLESIMNEFDIENGLNDQEVLENRDKFGMNKLDEGKKDSLFKLFFIASRNPGYHVCYGIRVLRLRHKLC